VLVASLENALLPRLSSGSDVTLVNAGGRVVVSSDPGYETGDRLGGTDPQLGAATRSVSSRRYPFSLIAPA
jgi:hypothetical protein